MAIVRFPKPIPLSPLTRPAIFKVLKAPYRRSPPRATRSSASSRPSLATWHKWVRAMNRHLRRHPHDVCIVVELDKLLERLRSIVSPTTTKDSR